MELLHLTYKNTQDRNPIDSIINVLTDCLNDVLCLTKMQEFTLHHKGKRHLGQKGDSIFRVSLVTRICNVWQAFPPVCQVSGTISSGIGRHFVRYWAPFRQVSGTISSGIGRHFIRYRALFRQVSDAILSGIGHLFVMYWAPFHQVSGAVSSGIGRHFKFCRYVNYKEFWLKDKPLPSHCHQLLNVYLEY